MAQKGFVSVALAILVLVVLSLVGYIVLVKRLKETKLSMISGLGNRPSSWRTYENKKFGFKFNYPSSFRVRSRGPNEVQKALEHGEMISGTIPPSYDTIIFSDATGKKKFDVIVFTTEDKISINAYKNNSLSIGSDCDARGIESSGEPVLLNMNGISVLEVQVRQFESHKSYDAGCFYFKNAKGYLTVFNIADFTREADFLNVFNFVHDQILPTLNLMD